MANKDDNFIKAEVLKYQETGTLSAGLAKIFMYIATKYVNTPRRERAPAELKEDMVAHAVMQMTKSCKKVRTDRGMMFAYLGTVARCAFAYVENSEARQRDVVRDKTEYDSCGDDNECLG